MVLAPINTDAPLYHWPRATVGLVAANLLAFLLTSSGALGSFEEFAPRYALTHGAGLRPWQWLTSNFIHRDALHLVRNMMFLWGLGLVVEGKIGWRWFLSLYLGLGISECALEQLALGQKAFTSFGSSAIIFGLLAVALVWAPRNDLIVAYWLPAQGVGTIDLSITAFSVIVLGTQGLLAWWIGPAVMLHLLGGLLGFVAATIMLRRGLVDCEGWDLYSVLRGRHGKVTESDDFVAIQERPPEQRPVVRVERRRKPVDPERAVVRRKAKVITRVRALLHQDRPLDAYAELRKTQQVLSNWQLPVHDQLELADALHRAGRWNEAVALWEEYVEQHPQDIGPIRIQAAAVILQKQQRPHAALRMLEPLETASLHPRLAARRDRIRRDAQRLIDNGVIELDSSAWR